MFVFNQVRIAIQYQDVSVYQTMVLHGYEPIERQVMRDGSTVVVWLMQIILLLNT